MYILLAHDEINISFGPNSVTESSEILGIGSKEKMLEKASKIEGYNELKDNGEGLYFGCANYYDGEEKGQYLIVKELKGIEVEN